MCVLAFACDAHPRWRLVLAGNRDERHARDSAPIGRWIDAPVYGGRDLEAGGTWLAADAFGRAGVVTNVRDGPAVAVGAAGPSRGLLVADFLRGSLAAGEFARRIDAESPQYRPFNVVLFDTDGAWFAGNHPRSCAPVEAGRVHGLSNGALDAPWPKTLRIMAALREWLVRDAGEPPFTPLFDALADRTIAPDASLPDTGVGPALERRLSPVFVRGSDYGTRASTVLALSRAGGGVLVERRFGPDGMPIGESHVVIEPA